MGSLLQTPATVASQLDDSADQHPVDAHFDRLNDLVEIVEIPSHPWFVAVQYHPEFKSKPTQAHPLFRDFVEVFPFTLALDGDIGDGFVLPI